jgi:hypothetical protein
VFVESFLWLYLPANLELESLDSLVFFWVKILILLAYLGEE